MFSISKNSSIFINVCLLLILLLSYPQIPDNGFSVSIERYLIYVAAFLVLVFLLAHEGESSIKGQLFRPSLLFLIGYCIVCFQYDVDLLLGIKDPESILFYSQHSINKSTFFSVIGLTCYSIGYLGYKKRVESYENVDSIIGIISLKLLYIFSSVLYGLYHIGDAISGAYSQASLEAQAGSLLNYSEILLITVHFSLLAISVYNLRIKNNGESLIRYLGPWVNIVFVVVTIITLLTGERGSVIITVLSYAFAYVLVTNRKIGLKSFLSAVLVGALSITLLGIIRSNRTTSSREAFELAMSNESVIPFTGELAGSINTFNAAIDYVPSKHDYLLGSFQVRGILAAIPFSSRIVTMFVSPEKKYRSSAFFCTYIIQGEDYSYGNGTCLLADLYLSFGIIGILLGMIFVGYFIRKVEMGVFTNKNASLTYITLGLYAIAYSIYENRASLLTPLNYMVFTMLLNYFYVKKIVKK